MSFFQRFPTAIFSIGKNDQRVITDIFRRVIFSVPDNTAVLLPYVVLDGETPELVSQRLYGTPLYHWVLILVNEIVDVRTEWPLEDRFLTPLVYDKYPFSVTVPDTSVYKIGGVVTSSDGGRFRVEAAEAGTLVMRSLVGQTFLTTQSLLTNLTTNTTGHTVVSVIDPEEAVHHYRDIATGYEVDPDESNPNIEAVSNLDHETRVNDEKRHVRVIDPQRVATIANAILTTYSA